MLTNVCCWKTRPARSVLASTIRYLYCPIRRRLRKAFDVNYGTVFFSISFADVVEHFEQTGHRCFKLLYANQTHNNHAVSNRSLRFSGTKSVAQRQLHVTSVWDIPAILCRSENSRQVIPSLQGDASSQSPPDLPSYIFKERIVYLVSLYSLTLLVNITMTLLLL